MQTKVTTINFNGQNVYAGLDVHLKSWKVTIMVENILYKTFSQDPSAEALSTYLKRNFPGANYFSAYEAGFCGFSVHRELETQGISNIVVNPADIPTKDKDKKQKEDKRDSRKIARALHNGDLVKIHVPDQNILALRSLSRYRSTLVKEICRNKLRIKAYLYQNGIRIPSELDTASIHWSGRFTQWLKSIEMATSYGNIALQETIETTEYLRKKLLQINRHLNTIYKDSEYSKILKLIRSVPGIGLVLSLTILTELDNIKRFKNLDNLCSFVGLVPSTKSSGEKENAGPITNRSNKALRNHIIESSWAAIRLDPALAYRYNELCKRMNANEAIVRIAKKLLSRIRYVIINETEYVPSVN